MTYPLTETEYRDTLSAHMPPGSECKQSTQSQLMCKETSTLHKPSTAIFFPLVLPSYCLYINVSCFPSQLARRRIVRCPRLNRELSARPTALLSPCACCVEIVCLSRTLDCFVHPSFTLSPQSSEVFLPFSFTDLLLSLPFSTSLSL